MNIWDKVVDFHGHACCILAIGYRAALLAREKLAPVQEGDKLFAFVDTVDCSTDAVQVVLNCTTGNRRLLARERGKYAFTVARPGKAVRVVLKPGIINRYGKNFASLMEKVANGTASPVEQEQFYTAQQPLMEYILQSSAEELFNYSETVIELPEPGYNFTFVVCQRCGEETLANHVTTRDGKQLCLDCQVKA